MCQLVNGLKVLNCSQLQCFRDKRLHVIYVVVFESTNSTLSFILVNF